MEEKPMQVINNITYQINRKLITEEVSNLFKKSGINRPAEDLDRIQRMIENADINISAWDNDLLVGIARSITDYSFCCYLSDLAVDKDYQNRGIGKELVRITKEHIGEEVSLILLASPIAMEYYPHIGFEKLDNCFAIRKIR
jgi:ribosomal protein S18 acetylase RimI-like enzyme